MSVYLALIHMTTFMFSGLSIFSAAIAAAFMASAARRKMPVLRPWDIGHFTKSSAADNRKAAFLASLSALLQAIALALSELPTILHLPH